MTVLPLIRTQLVPPQIKNSIKRAGLRDLGLAILSHRVTTVTAPAGYGKSVWVSSLAGEPEWPPTAWLSLDSFDSEPACFLYHLIHAAKRVLPGFGVQSLRTMNSLEDANKDWLIALSTFIEELPPDKALMLVLDDLYLMDKNPVICSMLEHLIHYLPPRAHLLLISRNTPPLNLYQELLKGELLEIKKEHLLFSAGEGGEMLAALGIKVADEDLPLIHSCTEGWAVGLRLFGLFLMRSGGDIKNTLAALNGKDTDLYTYLSNELLGHLPGELQNFLLNSSLLPYLEPALCDAALECADSKAKITELHSYGLLSQTADELTSWRLHHLMSDFLKQKALSLRPPDYIISLRRRAMRFLQSKGDIDRALEQAVACPDWTAVITLIHTHGDNYFLQNGRLDGLNSWISHIPQELTGGDCRLLYFKGMSILHTKPEDALDILSRAAHYAEKKGEIKCQLRSLLAMIAVYTLANNVKKVKETAGRIPIAASLLGGSWSRGMILIAALSQAAWSDNLQQGVWFSRLAGKSKLDPESRMAYLIFSCVIQYRLGNLTAAREFIEKALSDPYIRENERWTGTAYTIYSVICVLAGDHDKLRTICEELLRLGKKYHIPHQLGIAYRRLALLHLWNGFPAEARKEFELSRSAFLKSNNLFYTYLLDLDLILMRVMSGANARDLLGETQHILNKLKTLPGGQGLDDYALSTAGIIAMEAGELQLARKRFLEVLQNCLNKGARQVLAGTQLLLARSYLLEGDYDPADSYLAQALSSAEAEKWEFFWDWHPETMYSLCRRALLQKIRPQWAAHLLRRWFAQRTCEEAGNLLIYPSEHVRNSMTLLIQEVTQETGILIIHVNFLGGFHVFINGMEIAPKHWKTQKAENLFKYLIIERGRHPKEKIIETLWPESDPHLGDASLRMALTHVRKALGLDNKHQESIILKRGMIYLNSEIKIQSDYQLFTALAQKTLKNADMNSPLTLSLLEEAAQLYRGEFLPDSLYEDWTFRLRTELHHLNLQVLLMLIEAYRQQGKLSLAIGACRRYLDLEPVDETVCRTTMNLLCHSGQKQQALFLYQELAARLLQDYDTVPLAETNTLYEKIRAR
ncbi:MAG: BTAD domain-containing putative transcriptional regulator [Peptococcaceae bacterium]